MRARFLFSVLAALTAATLPIGVAQATPSNTWTDAMFAGSYAAKSVTSTVPTELKDSCYSPEVTYFGSLPADAGYVNGGMTACDGATTGENLGPYATQNVANPAMKVKDHSESDIRVDPTNTSHLIGQSKWVVSAEGYNHLLGFYESFDGGATWPVQGHVPGYEGWTDNTDPVGAFDPWGNFYSLVLPYVFYYDKSGAHKYDNGSNQTNPTVPPEAISVSVRPAVGASDPARTDPNRWLTTHNGKPDYIMTAKNANTGDPDKQWITVDTTSGSPHYGRVYAMWTVFVLNPSVIEVSYADANPDGTHSDWSTPQILPTISGKRWDTYMLPHVAPDGTVYTTVTNNPVSKSYLNNDIYLDWSTDGGVTWQGPLLVVSGVLSPTYQNTTFREGIVNTFTVGPTKVNGSYPLYVSYENEGSDGLSNVWLTGSFNGGQTWTAPARVNDNSGPTEALQPNLNVAANGTVTLAFYDRRLPCPAADTVEAAAAGLQNDPAHPYGASNYCVNTAIQFYKPNPPNLAKMGHNLRLSAHTWDPQLSSPHPSCICSSTTFIGDYFGVDSAAGYTYTTSVTTYDDGLNASNYQQQLVSRIATP